MSGADRFRRLALALPDAVESSHMGAADFRLHNRIFATLAYEKRNLGTLKLTPEQQAAFLAEAADGVFQLAPGGWGRMGMTLVDLDAPEEVIAGGLQRAHRNLAEKPAKAAGKRRSPKA